MKNLLLQIQIIIKKLIELHRKLLAKKKEKRILLIRLAEAMAHFEGWNMPKSLCRRNHNPLNLRYSKYATITKNGFAFFLTDEIGWKAGLWDLCMKCQGKTRTGLKPRSTIKNLIYVWAPPSENVSDNYVSYVCERLGIEKTYRLKNFILDTYC